MKEAIGWFLIVLPFILITYVMVKGMGWLLTFKVWRDTVLICGTIAAGVYLVFN